MIPVLVSLLAIPRDSLVALQAEVRILRHHLLILQRMNQKQRVLVLEESPSSRSPATVDPRPSQMLEPPPAGDGSTQSGAGETAYQMIVSAVSMSSAVGFDFQHHSTTVRLKIEQNQLVGVSGEIGILFDALKGV